MTDRQFRKFLDMPSNNSVFQNLTVAKSVIQVCLAETLCTSLKVHYFANYMAYLLFYWNLARFVSH
jgi:hypothetical protein